MNTAVPKRGVHVQAYLACAAVQPATSAQGLLLGPIQFIGWFEKPAPFSETQAGMHADTDDLRFRPSDLPSVLRLCLSFPRLERALRKPGVSFFGVGLGVIQKTCVDLNLSACACCQRLTLIRGSSHKQESADGLSPL